MAVSGDPDVPRAIRHLRDPESVDVPPRFIDYPRAGKRGVARWIPSWRQVGAVTLLGFTGVMLSTMIVYAKTPVPTANAGVSNQKTIVYYADGKTELGRFGDVDRRIVGYEAIPQHMRDAVVAAEDRSFYTNSGISVKGIARAAVNNFRGGSLQGGSTITQQYVKNSRLDSTERTMSRKTKEFFISVKVAKQMTKDEILTNYLNAIYFGRNAYGIDAAAQAYYRKSITQIKPSEAAYLAGTIACPGYCDPDNGEENLQRAIGRWAYVLDGMVVMGKLSAAERDQLKAKGFPKPKKERAGNSKGGQRGYLIDMVEAELTRKLGLTKPQIDNRGLRVVTTFDERLVEAGVDAVKDTAGKLPERVQVAMASIDPATGAVKAIYGGQDYVKVRQQNAAVRDAAQAGSTFKPFCLVAALEKGISLRSRFDGRTPQTFADGYVVNNYSNDPVGTIDLMTATANSVNTVYVALNEQVGAGRTKEVAERAGIPETKDLEANLGNVLGVATVHPIDLANAYATFAAEGVRHEWFTVTSVAQSVKGKYQVFYQAQPKGEQEFDREVIADATFAMQQVVQRGSGSYARALNRPAAGKTGTSQNNRSAWFAGFTPQLSTVVAMYRISEDGKGQDTLPGFGGFRSITGATFPVRIWTAYMQQALDGTEVKQFPTPRFGGQVLNPQPTWTERPEESRTREPGPTRTERPTWTIDPSESPSPTWTDRPTTPDEPPPTTDDGGGGDDDETTTTTTTTRRRVP